MFYSGKMFFSGAIAWSYAKEKGLDVTEFLRSGTDPLGEGTGGRIRRS